MSDISIFRVKMSTFFAQVALVAIVSLAALGCSSAASPDDSGLGTSDVINGGDDAHLIADAHSGTDAAMPGHDVAVADVARTDASVVDPDVVRTVGSCSNLGAPGTWVNILPQASVTGQGMAVINAQGLAQDPFDVGTLWMGASSVYPMSAGGVYKSTDCGATWVHVNTGTNGSAIDRAAIWSLAVDFVNRGTIYVVGAYGPGNVWKSTDGGVNFVPLLPEGDFASNFAGNFVASVTMDPHDPLHLVVAPHGNCSSTYGPMCNAETTDGGAHWRLFHIPGSGWGEATGPYLLNATSWLSTLEGLWLTTDSGATWSDVKPAHINYVTGGEFTNRPLRPSALGHYYLGSQQDNGLITSTDGRTWTHIEGTPNGQYELAFTSGGGKLFLGDFSGNDYQVADEAHPDTWTRLPSPAAQRGPVNLEYDAQHHVLYSTNFEGGFWRLVLE